ncbi:MAG: hypothetical protein ABIH76_04485 [Candidatus Bathyarchaeota archaeon]
MASVIGGPVTWSADRDDEGYKTYKVTHRVQAEITESPAAVMSASGLPAIGSSFQIDGYSGIDSWCFCRPEMSVRIDQEKEGDPASYYLVENTFSNKYETGGQRCQDFPIENPLLEPMKVGGSFAKAQYVARYDKDGVRLISSAGEPLLGPNVTFDYARPTVHIEQNVASLGLSTFSSMVNTVNASPLWGCPARCVKLANVPWERKVYGICNHFYIRTFEFEIDYYNQDDAGNPIGFDKQVRDEGSMCIRGGWIPDVNDANYGKFKLDPDVYLTTTENILTMPATNFMAYRDMKDNASNIFLDGHGLPHGVGLLSSDGYDIGSAGPPASATLKYYRESNFLLLGIPTSF